MFECIQSFLSCEVMFVFNNVMFCMCGFIVLWGTFYFKFNEFGVLFVVMVMNFFVYIGEFT